MADTLNVLDDLRQPPKGLFQPDADECLDRSCACRHDHQGSSVLRELPDLQFRRSAGDRYSRRWSIALHDAIRAADGVLIVSAEYNWSIPGGLKNAIDWLSRYKEVALKNKPCCIQSAAPGLLGGSRMQYHLRMSLTSVDAILFGKPEVIVNLAASKFADGALKDQGALDLIKQQLAAFGDFIKRVRD